MIRESRQHNSRMQNAHGVKIEQVTQNGGNIIPEWGMQNANVVNKTRIMKSRHHNSRMLNTINKKQTE